MSAKNKAMEADSKPDMDKMDPTREKEPDDESDDGE